MDDKTVQRKLNQLVKIANELDQEAKRRWLYGQLFFEAEGGFYLMESDSGGYLSERQKGIRFSSDGHCSMGCGAW